jgi:hypothetical protein
LWGWVCRVYVSRDTEPGSRVVPVASRQQPLTSVHFALKFLAAVIRLKQTAGLAGGSALAKVRFGERRLNSFWGGSGRRNGGREVMDSGGWYRD